MKNAGVYAILFFIFILGIASVNNLTNSRLENKCINAGGQFYKALDPANSLCKLPTNKG